MPPSGGAAGGGPACLAATAPLGFFVPAKNPGGVDAPDVELVEEHGLHDRESVAHRGAEGDLGSLVEITRLDRDLADREPFGHSLSDDLSVEHETVGVLFQIYRLEIAAAVSAEPAVILGQIDEKRRIFDRREEDVAQIL